MGGGSCSRFSVGRIDALFETSLGGEEKMSGKES